MSGLWRNQDGTREGKYLVVRRDGTVPEWPYFVIGAADPAAPAALMQYAEAVRVLVSRGVAGLTNEYADDVERLAEEFDVWRREHGGGDPGAPRHRTDDPFTVARMRKGMP